MISKSNYTVIDDHYRRLGVLGIVDEHQPDHHTLTVTNNAEAVIAELAASGRLRDIDAVIYCDTEKRWDQIEIADFRFAGFKTIRATRIETALAVVATEEKRRTAGAWRFDFADEEYEHFLTGKSLVPNFDPMEPGVVLNAIAAGGLLSPGPIKAARLTPDGASPWARYFFNHGQSGRRDGTGIVAIYGNAYPPPGGGHGGRFAICRHDKVVAAGADQRRGWHPGWCWKCGLDLTVDSGD